MTECPDEMAQVAIGIGSDGQSAGDASTPSGYTWNTTNTVKPPSLDVDVNNYDRDSYFTQIEFEITGAESVDVEVNNETKVCFYRYTIIGMTRLLSKNGS